MAILGISLILASVVIFVIRAPSWLPAKVLLLLPWHTQSRGSATSPLTSPQDGATDKTQAENGTSSNVSTAPQGQRVSQAKPSSDQKQRDAIAMPPPPPPPIIEPPTVYDSDEATTPKATAIQSAQSIPTFSLDSSPPAHSTEPLTASPRVMMPPPAIPNRLPTMPKPPTLPQFPAANSAQRARGPLPNRGPPSSSLSPGNSLVPPPTHSSKPSKPSRKVLLEPGHSPLDWARISGPNADLRGVPGSTSYLRVTPSMLKAQTGRKGKDAWMALDGRVYNVTPYAKFHPGGVPELMRGAGRDGTKLFGEIHPWVNYETMLAACWIGLLVEEPAPDKVSEMDEMD